MKFIKDFVPLVKVVKGDEVLFTIESMQELDEQDDRVYVKCAEYVDILKRGLTCDLDCSYQICDKYRNVVEENNDVIRDLVLVYVNKYMTIDGYPEFEYVFFK